jgi:UDP-glucose 4-epimerase
VKTIADIVAEEMGLSRIHLRYTGGKRGWTGDVSIMQLSLEKIRSLGWQPEYGSEEGVRMAVRAMLAQQQE